MLTDESVQSILDELKKYDKLPKEHQVQEGDSSITNDSFADNSGEADSAKGPEKPENESVKGEQKDTNETSLNEKPNDQNATSTQTFKVVTLIPNGTVEHNSEISIPGEKNSSTEVRKENPGSQISDDENKDPNTQDDPKKTLQGERVEEKTEDPKNITSPINQTTSVNSSTDQKPVNATPSRTTVGELPFEDRVEEAPNQDLEDPNLPDQDPQDQAENPRSSQITQKPEDPNSNSHPPSRNRSGPVSQSTDDPENSDGQSSQHPQSFNVQNSQEQNPESANWNSDPYRLRQQTKGNVQKDPNKDHFTKGAPIWGEDSPRWGGKYESPKLMNSPEWDDRRNFGWSNENYKGTEQPSKSRSNLSPDWKEGNSPGWRSYNSPHRKRYQAPFRNSEEYPVPRWADEKSPRWGRDQIGGRTDEHQSPRWRGYRAPQWKNEEAPIKKNERFPGWHPDKAPKWKVDAAEPGEKYPKRENEVSSNREDDEHSPNWEGKEGFRRQGSWVMIKCFQVTYRPSGKTKYLLDGASCQVRSMKRKSKILKSK